MNEQTVMKAYLYLSAPERVSGEMPNTLNIHVAWICYCRIDEQPGYELFYAAQSMGMVS